MQSYHTLPISQERITMSELSSIVEFSVNLKDVEAPSPLPAGEYTGAIRAAEVKMSQRDTRYGAISFFIGPEQYPADFTDGNPDGMTLIYRRVSLEDNPQARYGCKRFIEAIGAPLAKSVNVDEWVGMEASLEVVHEEWEGVTRAAIARVRAA
jgi:hypothetical protein